MATALPRVRAIPFVIWCLAALCVLPELVLTGADWGLWGSARWRPLAYAQGAFWAGLLHGWLPNYSGQSALMFLTYCWLHAGALHLCGNLGALFWLGPSLAQQLGVGRFLTLWLAGAIGGAGAFGVLTEDPGPMVGASGAVFGLAAAAVLQNACSWRHRITLTVGLLVLNLLAWVLAGGQLAWETHLGGMVAGAAAMTGLRHSGMPP